MTREEQDLYDGLETALKEHQAAKKPSPPVAAGRPF
jgi:hypothetical protein